eukprot:gene3037-biopygen6622
MKQSRTSIKTTVHGTPNVRRSTGGPRAGVLVGPQAGIVAPRAGRTVQGVVHVGSRAGLVGPGADLVGPERALLPERAPLDREQPSLDREQTYITGPRIEIVSPVWAQHGLGDGYL